MHDFYILRKRWNVDVIPFIIRDQAEKSNENEDEF